MSDSTTEPTDQAPTATTRAARRAANTSAQALSTGTAPSKTRGGFKSLPFVRIFVPPEERITVEARDVDTTSTEVAPWTLPGSQLRDKGRRARSGFYAPAAPGAPTTTRQAEILNTALIAPPTGTKGVVVGRDVLSRTATAHDSITAYNSQPRLVSSPNVITMGDVGAGKSSGTKCNDVIRPMLLANRRIVVFDKKDQAGEGEYSGTARRYGYEPIKFTADGSGTRLNLMDPDIARGTGTKGQSRLLQTVTRIARDDQALDEWEKKSIRAALQATLDRASDGRAPVISDVLPELGRVADADLYSSYSLEAKERLHQAGIAVRLTLEDLLEEYDGLLDGETSSSVNLDGKLTSFDISQLPDEGPAVPVVMAIGNMWMLGRLRNDRGWATNIVYEEGWHMIGGPSANLIKSNQKLSRGLGIANVFVMHKGTDIPANSPGMAIIQEAQTVRIYRQSRPEDARWCQQTFGLAPETADTIEHLQDGHFIFKYSDKPETHVQHLRSQWEIEVTNTDEALAAGSTPGAR